MKATSPMSLGFIGLVLFALLSGGCATNPVTGKRDLVLMSEDEEIQLGRQAHQQILKQYRLYEDPELQAYVSRIGEELANKSHRSDLAFHFTVLDSPEVNAFALPGGYVYITRGILAYMNSEAEMAGVLGHEIGHVTARHSVRQHTANTASGLLAVLVTAQAGGQVGQLSNVLGTALVRGYGRSHELEADRLGAEYLARTGYDPNKMLEVIDVLKSQEEFAKQRAKEQGREPRVYHGVFASHPENDQRLQEVIGAAHKFQADSTRASNRDEYLRHVDGLVFGAGENDGVLRGNRFYHRDLGITMAFPTGWIVDNRSERLIARTKDPNALIQVTVQALNRKLSPRQVLAKQFGNRVRQGEPLSLEPLSGYTGFTNLDTPYGRKAARVAAVIDGKRVFMFAAASKPSLTNSAIDRIVLASISSLRRLTPDESALAQPGRVRIITAREGETFEALAKRSSLSHHALEQLRLLNGMYPDGQPKPGDRIKIVE